MLKTISIFLKSKASYVCLSIQRERASIESASELQDLGDERDPRDALSPLLLQRKKPQVLQAQGKHPSLPRGVGTRVAVARTPATICLLSTVPTRHQTPWAHEPVL